MLHWPDSMFTYLTGRKILMPNDAFGQHYATAFRFNDQVNQAELYQEAIKYYANILTPFSRRCEEDRGTPRAESASRDHRAEPRRHLAEGAAADRPQVPGMGRAETGAVGGGALDTMWQATRRMAEAVGAGLAAEGVPFKLFHMAVSDRNDVLTEVFKARAVIIGSPTLNNGLLPAITPILEDLKGLNSRTRSARRSAPTAGAANR